MFLPREPESGPLVTRCRACRLACSLSTYSGAAAQLRLQRAVEGLSVVVLTYYLANLLKLILEGTEAAGISVHATLVVALFVPLLAGGVWWAVRGSKRPEE